MDFTLWLSNTYIIIENKLGGYVTYAYFCRINIKTSTMEKINFINNKVKGVIGRDLVGCKIAITDSVLQRDIEADCERHCWADIVERMAYVKPETLQEAIDQLNYYWDTIWLTDGLLFQKAGNKIVIGSEAKDNDGKKEGWIYNDLMTIEITD